MFLIYRQLPAGATNINITSVEVNYSVAYTQAYSFKITKLTTINPSDDGANWSAIGSGSVMNNSISYSGNSNFISTNIKTQMQNALSSNQLILGALSENETANDSYANLGFTLYVTYTRTAATLSLVAHNDFHGQDGGQIGVGVNTSPVSYSSPKPFSAVEGQTVNLAAYDGQTLYNYDWVFNDNEAPLTKSYWKKYYNGALSDLGNAQSISHTAQSENGATFIDYLKKNFRISRNDETEFDGTSSAGIVTHIVEGNSGNIPAPSTKTIGSNNYVLAGWENGFNGVSTPADNTTYTAIYKVVHKSNNAAAFTSNSQRKLVRTKDGWLHQVYESMGHVWYEAKSPTGSWQIMNNGQPLDNGSGSKCPSIDWHYNTADPNNSNYNAIVIVYQQQSGSTYTIEYAIFRYTNGSYERLVSQASKTLYTEPAGGDQYATTNANPNIAWGYYYRFVLSFERKSTVGSMQPGIYWIYGYMDEFGVESYYSGVQVPLPTAPVKITGTTSSSINATLSLNKDQNNDGYLNFHIVYQAGTSPSSNIIDVLLRCEIIGGSWVTSQLNATNISYGTGFLNYKPSMVETLSDDIGYKFKVCWIRDFYGGGSNTPYLVNAVYYDPTVYPTVINYSGNMVYSVSLNILDGGTNTYYAFAQHTNNSNWQNFAKKGSSTITLSTTGRYIQLSNGSSSSDMYASAYYPASLPYYFQTSNSLGGLQKSSSSEENTYGRGIILGTNDIEFSYSIKSLAVDKNNIKFIEIPERKDTTVKRRGMQRLMLDSLNTFMVSEPFTIQNGTMLSLSGA